MKKKSVAFVFFGQNRIEKFIVEQINEINKANKFHCDKFNFYLIDATRNGIQCSKDLLRINLQKAENTKIADLDPLARYRSSGESSKISGGMIKATAFLQIFDYLEFTSLENKYDFIFRLRTDVLVNEKLILEAIENVIPNTINTPYSFLKHKVWVQFFHLFVPFYIHDTAFLISSRDLKLISEEALIRRDFYPTYANPMCFWGPYFYKKVPYLFNLVSNYISEIQEKPKLKIGTLKLFPIYWKIISANFHISFNPKVKFRGQWNLNKVETRLWKNISINDLVELSLFQIRFIFNNYD